MAVIRLRLLRRLRESTARLTNQGGREGWEGGGGGPRVIFCFYKYLLIILLIFLLTDVMKFNRKR